MKSNFINHFFLMSDFYIFVLLYCLRIQPYSISKAFSCKAVSGCPDQCILKHTSFPHPTDYWILNTFHITESETIHLKHLSQLFDLTLHTHTLSSHAQQCIMQTSSECFHWRKKNEDTYNFLSLLN